MTLDPWLTASSLAQGAEAILGICIVGGSILIAVLRRRPRASFAAHQNVRVSRSNNFTLSGTARNVEPGTLHLFCERLDGGIPQYLDCGQIVLTGQVWQHRVLGSVGGLHEDVTFLLMHVTPPAADALSRQSRNAAGAVLHRLPLPKGCEALDRINVTIAFA